MNEIGIYLAIVLLIGLYIYVNSKLKSEDNSKQFVDLDNKIESIKKQISDEMRAEREERNKAERENRNEITDSIFRFQNQIVEQINNTNLQITNTTDKFNLGLDKLGNIYETKISNLTESVLQKLTESQDRQEKANTTNREELAKAINQFTDSFIEAQKESAKELRVKLQDLQGSIQLSLDRMMKGNEQKLDEMRNTVDEKLQKTLENRLSESFKMVSERLEQVHKGLGDMQSLASDVGNLSKVMSGVKTRGVMGEVQLNSILEEILSTEQYETNFAAKSEGNERVEVAIKMPGRNSENPVYLPIDSKFPMEDYMRLLEAYDSIGIDSKKNIDELRKKLGKAVENEAKKIKDKYINPPLTTDFAFMFVPTEGLFSEILRIDGLFEKLRRDFKITVVGPTNIVGLLSSLKMGFQTLAIEKKSSEVWDILSNVKSEFGKFEEQLAKAQSKISAASKDLDTLVGTRTRAVNRVLKSVSDNLTSNSVQTISAKDIFNEDALLLDINNSED